MQKKKAISLIVLVITIIVMIILAGAIILTLNNSGIIKKASDAVEETDIATVKELAQMAWAEAYLQPDNSLEAMSNYVLGKLDTKIKDKYVIEVTTKGVNVVLKGPWVQTRETVTNGDITINVGEKINYTATGTDYTEDWKVLGASEYGELLIMSDSYVTTHRLGYKSTATDSAQKLKESQEAWLNGADELDEICEAYGKGEGATGARSVTVEDINRVTGYDPEAEKYKKGQLHEYGNEVTYMYNGTTKPDYKYTKEDGTEVTGTLTNTHSSGFHFYNGTKFVHVNDLTIGTSGKTFATLKNDFYDYYTQDLDTIEYGSRAYIFLFGEDDIWYWLASPYILTYAKYTGFGLRKVESGWVRPHGLWYTDGSTNSYGLGVRAVVSLATDITVGGSSEGGWNINI